MSARRIFTEAEDDVIRASQRGEITIIAACAQLRTAPETYYRRVSELGLSARHPAPLPKPPSADLANVGPGWVSIAHGGGGRWREYDGTPIGLADARFAVALGHATMAQRRIDGEFDLLFRVVA